MLGSGPVDVPGFAAAVAGGLRGNSRSLELPQRAADAQGIDPREVALTVVPVQSALAPVQMAEMNASVPCQAIGEQHFGVLVLLLAVTFERWQSVLVQTMTWSVVEA